MTAPHVVIKAKNIGGWIADMREMTRKTQAQLAEEVMVSRQTIGDWESGKHQPNAGRVLQIVRAFGNDAERDGDGYLIFFKKDSSEWEEKYQQLERRFVALAKRLAELEEERMSKDEGGT